MKDKLTGVIEAIKLMPDSATSKQDVIKVVESIISQY